MVSLMMPTVAAQLTECQYTTLTFESLSRDQPGDVGIVPDGTLLGGLRVFGARWIRNTYLGGQSGYTSGAISGDTVLTNSTDAPIIFFDQFEPFEVKSLHVTPAYNGEKVFLSGYISSQILQYTQEEFTSTGTPFNIALAWRGTNRFEITSDERGDFPDQGKAGAFPYDGPREHDFAGVALDDVVIGRGACGCGVEGLPICGGSHRCLPGLVATSTLCLKSRTEGRPHPGLSTTATVGIASACAVLVLCTCCTVALLLIFPRHAATLRRNKSAGGPDSELPVYDDTEQAPFEAAMPAYETNGQPISSLHSLKVFQKRPIGLSAMSSSSNSSSRRHKSSVSSPHTPAGTPRRPGRSLHAASSRSFFSLFNSHPSRGSASSAVNSSVTDSVPVASRKATSLEAQLKLLMRQCQGHFVGMLLMPDTLCKGGQSVVVAATALADGSENVIKFFLNRDNFVKELTINRNEALRVFMPPMKLARDCEHPEQRCCAPDSSVLPCFMVFERGMPLPNWVACQRPDFFHKVNVLLLLARQLAALHAAGYVHRDVKPSNVLFVPSKASWSLIDFGSCAEANSAAPPSLSIRYAAPEVVCAHTRKLPEAPVDAASDVFSFGMLCAELLTRQAVFPSGTPEGRIIAAALGDRHYPWEDGGLSQSQSEALGFLCGSFLAMVARNPSQRPTMARLVALWERAINPHFAPDAATPAQPAPATPPAVPPVEASDGSLPLPTYPAEPPALHAARVRNPSFGSPSSPHQPSSPESAAVDSGSVGYFVNAPVVGGTVALEIEPAVELTRRSANVPAE